MTGLNTKAREEAARLRAAGDDGAADLVDALRKENERLRDVLGRVNDLCKRWYWAANAFSKNPSAHAEHLRDALNAPTDD